MTVSTRHARSKPSDHGKSDGHSHWSAQPHIEHPATAIQAFGSLIELPLGLDADVRSESVAALNQTLADTMSLRDLYKKHHWQVAGPTFYQLHLLFDKHFGEQSELVDTIAERIQTLGGVAIAMSHDVAEMTNLERPPRDREDPLTQMSRLLAAHELILKEARKGAKAAAEAGDDGTNDVLVSDVVRTNETQVWFVAEHLANLPLAAGQHEE
jgi:starvation-inducible DNA-binding protein